MAAIDYSESAIPDELTGVGLGRELFVIERAEENLKHRRISLEARAKKLRRDKVTVEGWDVTPAYGRVAWTKPVAEVIQLGDMMDVNVRKDDVITPNQAIKAGLSKELVNACSEAPDRGVKLVKDIAVLHQIRQVLNNE